MMLELLTGNDTSEKILEHDYEIVDKMLRKVERKLTVKESSDGQVRPGLSI